MQSKSKTNDIVSALHGVWYGRTQAMCRCPVHGGSNGDRRPSLSVRISPTTGRLLFHCFAGCSSHDVVQALRNSGLWSGARDSIPSPPPITVEAEQDTGRLRRMMREIWDRGQPIIGTWGQAYLRSRGIESVSYALRYLPSLLHGPSKTSHPAIIAKISDDSASVALHRIYLAPHGIGKAAVSPNKMTLGKMHGGTVRLHKVEGPELGLAEGIETALAARQMHNLVPVWATLSAVRLPTVEIPPHVRMVTIFGDNGPAGKHWAEIARRGFVSAGLSCQIMYPPSEYADFNDLLLATRGSLP